MDHAKVLVSDKLSEPGLDVLRAAEGIEVDYRPGLKEDELRDAIGDYHGLVIRSGSKVTAKVLERADNLKVIGRAGIGVDNVDIPAASKRGIVVMNTPTGNAVTTAEHALSLLMSLARKVPQATASMRAGKWEKSKFQGRELSGKTLGIIGLGNIGRIVANRAQGLKLNVIGADPVITSEKAAALGIELVPIDELLGRADFITIHAPLTSETKGLIDATAIDKLKKGALIVNAARGGIVDEQAAAKALEEGKLAGLALDVFEKEPVDPEHPLLKLDNVVVTPHLGASTSEAQERVAVEISEQVATYLREGTIVNSVNVPTLPKEVATKIEPYEIAARRLGRLLAQLDGGDVRELRVTCTGEAGELGVRPIANAAVAGYLQSFLEEPVSPISAPFLAKDRGLSVVEVREESGRVFSNSVEIALTGETARHSAMASLSVAREPRLVGLDDFELDAVLEGTTIVMHNEDQPGVIGAVGSILGKREVNVSSMQVGLDRGAGEAVALWHVDQNVPKDALEELRKLPNVRSVVVVDLG